MKESGRVFHSKLRRKLVRDLAASKWLFLAVAAVVFLGVALFGASFLGYRNLKTSYDYTYETLQFADFTVSVVEAPLESVEEAASIPGVAAVTGRLNADMALTLPGEGNKKVLARVISLPLAERPAVNDVKVEEGSYFDESDANAVLVEGGFAKYHGLRPGDTLSLMAGETETQFTVAGIVTSPEYIWPAKSRQELLTTPETFGVIFVPQTAIAGLTGKDAINELCFLVDQGEDRDVVIERATGALSAYSVTEVVKREDQPSNAALSLDLQEFAEMSEIFPFLFLIVAALATYILLTRIVQNQRAQIGLMRAIGYSGRQVMMHYLGFSLVIGIVGAVAGTVAGYLLSELVTNLYVGLLGLPYTSTRMGWVEWLAIEEGLLIGIVPCLVAGFLPARAAAGISPAAAMRPPAPTAGRKLLLEKIAPPLRRLSFLWKIPLRNIFRNRRRSLYTIIGVAFGTSLILVSAAFIDTIDDVMDFQFRRVQRYDAMIGFAEPQPVAALDAVAGWQGVERVEPVLQSPVSLEYDDKTYSTLVIGLSPDAELYGLYSPGGERTHVQDGGILLSESVRNVLGVRVGDTIGVDTPEGLWSITVVGFVKQGMGSPGYVSLNDAQQVLGSQPVANGLMLSVDPEYMDSVREEAYALTGAASVELTMDSRDRVEELMGFIRVMMWVMLGFGAALSLAIVFTTVTVGILERRREIATMRTLGESRGRITMMMTIENLLLGLAGLVPGIPLGYLLAMLMMRLVQTDMMGFDLVIFPRTYALTVFAVMLIVLASQVPAIRQMNRLNLASVTKEQAN
jgi:putative ABC transport system permease protein